MIADIAVSQPNAVEMACWSALKCCSFSFWQLPTLRSEPVDLVRLGNYNQWHVISPTAASTTILVKAR
jgi:hypothetical protein